MKKQTITKYTLSLLLSSVIIAYGWEWVWMIISK